jgi:hypothetical protein
VFLIIKVPRAGATRVEEGVMLGRPKPAVIDETIAVAKLRPSLFPPFFALILVHLLYYSPA